MVAKRFDDEHYLEGPHAGDDTGDGHTPRRTPAPRENADGDHQLVVEIGVPDVDDWTLFSELPPGGEVPVERLVGGDAHAAIAIRVNGDVDRVSFNAVITSMDDDAPVKGARSEFVADMQCKGSICSRAPIFIPVSDFRGSADVDERWVLIQLEGRATADPAYVGSASVFALFRYGTL
jgi:hypothetical protein